MIILAAALGGGGSVQAQDSNAFAGYMDLSYGLQLTRIGNLSIDFASEASGWGVSGLKKSESDPKRSGGDDKSTIVTATTANMANQLAAAYPANSRVEAQRVFRDLLARYGKIEQQLGIPRNDIAGATAMFLAGSFEAYRDTQIDPRHYQPLIEQMRSIIGPNPAYAKASATEKRAMYEQLAILGMFMATTRLSHQQNPTAQTATNMKIAAKTYLEQFLGTDADQVMIGAQGLRLAKGAPAK